MKDNQQFPRTLLWLETTSVGYLVLLYLYNILATGKIDISSIFWEACYIGFVFLTTRKKLDWGALIISLLLIGGVVYSGYLAISAFIEGYRDWPLAWVTFTIIFSIGQLILLLHPSSTNWLLVENRE